MVIVKEDIPRSYLFAARPGMMLSNVAFLTCGVSPIACPRALARSESIPITVCPSEAMNSSGA